MTKASRKPRRALELLAASRDGCTEAIMIAHGFAFSGEGRYLRIARQLEPLGS